MKTNVSFISNPLFIFEIPLIKNGQWKSTLHETFVDDSLVPDSFSSPGILTKQYSQVLTSAHLRGGTFEHIETMECV